VIGQVEKIQIEEVFELPCRELLYIVVAMPLASGIKMLEFAKRIYADRRKIVSIESGKINAAALDENDIHTVTDYVAQFALYRGIASAVHHQRTFAPEQTGCINQFRKFCRNFVIAELTIYRALKIGAVPEILHE